MRLTDPTYISKAEDVQAVAATKDGYAVYEKR